jgi:hypothetical protein
MDQLGLKKWIEGNFLRGNGREGSEWRGEEIGSALI